MDRLWNNPKGFEKIYGNQTPSNHNHVPISWDLLYILWWIFSIFNTLRSRQNGRYFPDGIFKFIFLNENASISNKIPRKFFLWVQ